MRFVLIVNLLFPFLGIVCRDCARSRDDFGDKQLYLPECFGLLLRLETVTGAGDDMQPCVFVGLGGLTGIVYGDYRIGVSMNQQHRFAEFADGLENLHVLQLGEEATAQGYVPKACRIGNVGCVRIPCVPVVGNAKSREDEYQRTYVGDDVCGGKGRYQATLAFADEDDAIGVRVRLCLEMADNSFQIVLFVEYRHIHRVVVAATVYGSAGEIKTVALKAQGIQRFEIRLAAMVRAVESVGDDGNRLFPLSVLRAAQNAVDAAFAVFDPADLRFGGRRRTVFRLGMPGGYCCHRWKESVQQEDEKKFNIHDNCM